MSQSQASSSGTGTATQTVQPVLHLRKHRAKSKVRWTEETVDNEHMNKKKTKICCIFHPQRDFGESSCSSSDDSESDASDAEPAGGGSPNAYEKQPKSNL